MTTKQILFSILLLGAVSTIGLAMDKNQKVRRFDKGGLTRLNNNTCCFVMADIVLQDVCNENNDVKIIEIIDNKKIQQGTIGSFGNRFHTSDRKKKDTTLLKFFIKVHNNDALFDTENQTIFYGNKTDINEYYNKRQLLDKNKRLKQKKEQLRFNENFVKQYCKEGQCEILKAEIEKTKQEINQMYQNL